MLLKYSEKNGKKKSFLYEQQFVERIKLFKDKKIDFAIK